MSTHEHTARVGHGAGACLVPSALLWAPDPAGSPGPWVLGGAVRASPSQAVVCLCAHTDQTCLRVLAVLALKLFKEKQGDSGPSPLTWHPMEGLLDGPVVGMRPGPADSLGVPPMQHRGRPVAGLSQCHRGSPWGGLAWTCLSCRDSLLLAMLCSALARGLIIPWIPALVPEKARKQARSNPLHTPLDPEAASEVRAAVEVPTPSRCSSAGRAAEEVRLGASQLPANGAGGGGLGGRAFSKNEDSVGSETSLHGPACRKIRCEAGEQGQCRFRAGHCRTKHKTQTLDNVSSTVTGAGGCLSPDFTSRWRGLG